jgi:hypothetical protein
LVNVARFTGRFTPQEQLLFSARRRARSALEKNSAEELRACSEAGFGIRIMRIYGMFY